MAADFVTDVADGRVIRYICYSSVAMLLQMRSSAGRVRDISLVAADFVTDVADVGVIRYMSF